MSHLLQAAHLRPLSFWMSADKRGYACGETTVRIPNAILRNGPGGPGET